MAFLMVPLQNIQMSLPSAASKGFFFTEKPDGCVRRIVIGQVEKSYAEVISSFNNNFIFKSCNLSLCKYYNCNGSIKINQL